MGFFGGSVVKNLPANGRAARDVGLIPGSQRSPGGEHGNPLQYSCLVNPHGQRSLACYSPWGCKELDMTEQHSTSTKCNLTDLRVIVSILVKYRKFDIFIYSITVSSSLYLISSTLNFRI